MKMATPNKFEAIHCETMLCVDTMHISKMGFLLETIRHPMHHRSCEHLKDCSCDTHCRALDKLIMFGMPTDVESQQFNVTMKLTAIMDDVADKMDINFNGTNA